MSKLIRTWADGETSTVIVAGTAKSITGVMVDAMKHDLDEFVLLVNGELMFFRLDGHWEVEEVA